MDKKAYRKYSQQIMELVRSKNESSSSSPLYQASDTFNVEKYEELREALFQKEGWGKKFTEEYIGTALRKLIHRLQNEGEAKNADRYFMELVAEIEGFSHEQIVYVPLDNIQMQLSSLPIGGVTLIHITDELLEELAEQAGAFTAKTQGEQEGQRLAGAWERDFKGVCAKYQIVAESERAEERAIEECQRVLELLRYTIYLTHAEPSRYPIGLKGEAPRTVRNVLVFSVDNEQFYHSRRFFGPSHPFLINTTAHCKNGGGWHFQSGRDTQT